MNSFDILNYDPNNFTEEEKNKKFPIDNLKEAVENLKKLHFSDENGTIQFLNNSVGYVYGFLYANGEPIYVGQSCEKNFTRISRHIIGQRSDCVGKNQFNPFDIKYIIIYPLPYLKETLKNSKINLLLNSLEFKVLNDLMKKSIYGSTCNENIKLTNLPWDETIKIIPQVIEVIDIRSHQQIIDDFQNLHLNFEKKIKNFGYNHKSFNDWKRIYSAQKKHLLFLENFKNTNCLLPDFNIPL